ncbi:MAG TPA: hypothetical protein ENG59_02460 [Chloroflexi bacterium]|nr:hypothetical protein [Chloroflexota bacterium]
MNEKLSEQTKQLRKQYARTFHNDGLLDFFVGWGLVSAGIYLLTSLTIFSFAGWMPIILIAPLKKRFVIPRFGYAKFNQAAAIPRPILIGAGTVILIGTLLVTFLGNQGFRVPVVVALLGLSLLFALNKGFNRVTVYAIFIPVFFIVGFGLNVLTPTIVILVGAVLMALGLYLFVKFLQKYPLEPEEEDGLS